MALEDFVKDKEIYVNPERTEKWHITFKAYGMCFTEALEGEFNMPKGYEQALNTIYSQLDSFDLPNNPFVVLEPLPYEGQKPLKVQLRVFHPKLKKKLFGGFKPAQKRFLGCHFPDLFGTAHIPIIFDNISRKIIKENEIFNEYIISCEGGVIIGPSGKQFELPLFYDQWN
jgi:hypothetical protein